MNRKGHDHTRITFNHDLDLGAVWAPDGTRIAFYSARGGVGQLFLVNGRQARAVTQDGVGRAEANSTS